MNTEICFFALVFGLLSFVDSGYGISCYSCNSATANDECARGSSSLPTKDCPAPLNKCGIFEYDILAAGKVIGTGFQRDCAPETGFCELVEKLSQGLLSTTDAGIKQKRCDICDKDKCNSVGKISGSLLSITFLVLISCNILGIF